MKENLHSSKSMHRFISEQIYQKRMDIYTREETQHMAIMLMEHFLKQDRNDILLDRYFQLDIITENLLQAAVDRIADYEPLQYVIGETYFYGRAFYVSPAVLVPRRETEELTDLLLQQHKLQKHLKILDIGTGSGCIAVTLQKEIPDIQTYAMDNSQEALSVAKANANRHSADVQWLLEDIMNFTPSGREYDIVVSNPPYVREAEAAEMKPNVLNFEPHAALFVQDDQPLIFYEKIVQLCKQYKLLKKGGKLFFEINEALSKATVTLLKQYGFDEVLLYHDMQGKERFLIAKK
jgi:release factor glutamine methyltransferase